MNTRQPARTGHWVDSLAALLLGLAHAAAFSFVWGAWLQLASLAALLYLVDTRNQCGARRAAFLAFAFGLGTFCAGISWLFISMNRYGGLPAPIAALAVMLLSAYLALFGTAAIALARWLQGPNGVDRRCAGQALWHLVVHAACWVLAELMRAWALTGFPWLSVGYAQIDGPLAAAAALTGVYGLGGLTIIVAGAAALLARSSRLSRAAVVGTCVAAALPFAIAQAAHTIISSPVAKTDPVRIRLLQGNVGQGMKFNPARSLRAMHDYSADILAGDAQLTVLPETAWTIPWHGTPERLVEPIRDHLRATNGLLALGLPMLASDASLAARGMLSNSVAILDGQGRFVARYDKQHLVPFGEFIPAGFGWFVAMMNIPLGEFARGAAMQDMLHVGKQSIAFNICYEDLFPSQIRAQVAAGATVLINVSNIGWFGDSHALGQHLNISRMRAIELSRPMLRATNTGMTASIGPDGSVLARLSPLTRGALDLSMHGRSERTPFSRFGHLPAALLSLLILGLALAARRRSARTG